MQGKKSFQDIFRECMIEGLRIVVGESGAKAVIFHLNLSQGIIDPADLHERMLSLFGMSGTLAIELRIVNVLFSKMGGNFEIDRSNNDVLLARNWKQAKQVFDEMGEESRPE